MRDDTHPRTRSGDRAAHVGDWLAVYGRTLDAPVRHGQIVEVPHADGSPPYLVHWLDDERRSLVFPGPDAVVTSQAPHAAAARRP
ncbi:DUF1918 domain-containing protein [Geodermatophilus sp. SYSU D00697]